MGPTTLLLVDDHVILLRILSDFLGGEEGILVVGTAGSAEEALEKAKELQPQVILLNLLVMPGLGDLSAIPRLRSMMPDVGIIVLSVLDAKAYREAALTAGADDFVAEASLYTDLIPAIQRLTQGRRFIGETSPVPA
jgi:DNA-binding NarL/FixJ family response regulator